MVKVRKSILVIVSLLLTSVVMISCGKKEKASVEETMKIVYNSMFHGDITGVEKVGMTKEDVEEIQEKQKVRNMNDIRDAFLENEVKAPEEDIERLYLAMLNSIKKLSVDVEVVNTNDKVANLKVGTTYIRSIELYEKAVTDAMEVIEKEGLTDQEAIKTRFIELYFNNLVDGYNNVEVSKDYRYLKRQFKLVDGFWQVEDEEAFADELSELALGPNE